MIRAVLVTLIAAFALTACAGPGLREYFKQQEQEQAKPIEKKPVFGD